MKIAALLKQQDGRTGVNFVTDASRLDFDGFKKVYPGRPATHEEVKAANLRSIPDGLSVWRCDGGRLLAIRDE